MDLNSFILLKGLLIILSILSDEPNLLKPIYVDIIVCIMLLNKCEGHSMEDIINNFPTKDDLVDFVNKIFYICEFLQCSLLQCCSRC